MKLLKPSELSELKKENPTMVQNAFSKASTIALMVILIVVVTAPIVKDNTLLVSLTFGGVVFVAVFNQLLQEKNREVQGSENND